MKTHSKGRPKLSEDDETVTINARVPAAVKRGIRKLGGGSTSAGLRALWAQRQKAEAKKRASRERAILRAVGER